MREAEGLFGIMVKVIKILNHIGGAALTFMMFLTVTDVLLRAFGHPIMGTYEIVSQSLAVVIGFGIPKVSFDRGHVYMEFVTERLSKQNRAISEPVVAGFKKDLTSKGYTEKEVDSWLAFIKERIQYWKGQEKAKKIPTAYEY